MLQIDAYADELQVCMSAELKLLNDYLELEKVLRSALIEKNWVKMESLTGKMEEISHNIRGEDNHRDVIMMEIKTSIGISSSDGFYDIVIHFSNEYREKLTTLYRGIKMSIAGIQGVTHGMESYIEMKTSLMRKMINNAYPDGKGRVYNRNGLASNRDSTSILLDRHL